MLKSWQINSNWHLCIVDKLLIKSVLYMLVFWEVEGFVDSLAISIRELAKNVPVEKLPCEKNELSKFIIAYFTWLEA